MYCRMIFVCPRQRKSHSVGTQKERQTLSVCTVMHRRKMYAGGSVCVPDKGRLMYLMSVYGPHCSPLYQGTIKEEGEGSRFEFPEKA
jgi:hypothetical protein